MRKFYLHKRNGIYYAEIISNSGVKLTAKSTGTRDRDEAVMIISGWLTNGLPSAKEKSQKTIESKADVLSILNIIKKAELNKDEAMAIVTTLRKRELIDFSVIRSAVRNETLISFLLQFWDINKSPYLKDKIAHGHKITANYCREAINKIKSHWLPNFFNTPLNEVSRSSLREFSNSLKAKGLAGNTIKNIMIVGKTAFKWAYVEGMIPSDPSCSLMNFTGDQVSRDILTEKETEKLFKVKWEDKRAYTASLLSLTTGLRSGEIRALRKKDIGNSTLNISNSWNNHDGLKSPKNGERRVVPLLPQLCVLLGELLSESPHAKNDNPFIFYSYDNPNIPCCSNIFLRYFRIACKKANINIDNRKLDFHSFRHLFSTRMAERIEEHKVAKITGHRSEAAARIYQNHVTARILSEMHNAVAQEFASILNHHNSYEKNYEKTVV